MFSYLTGKEASEIDKFTINVTGIPGISLMENAAGCVADFIAELSEGRGCPLKALFVCENGNNGGDGVAAARILKERGFETAVYLINAVPKKTDSFMAQYKKAVDCGVPVYSGDNVSDNASFDIGSLMKDYDVLVDAVFGVGLSRDVGGIHADIIEKMNESSLIKVAVDIPSGINSESGSVMGTAFRADHTVTFGSVKTGMLFKEGRKCSGNIRTCDIGFSPEAYEAVRPKCFGLSREDVRRILPQKDVNSNKGTNGRVLIIAGSEEMCGAAYLSAAAAYRAGAGLVKIFTPAANRTALSILLPEALITTYDEADAMKRLKESLEWATSAAIGPGLGKSGLSKLLVEEIIKNAEIPLVVDADALNIISGFREDVFKHRTLAKKSGIRSDMTDSSGTPDIIITPHMLEMARLIARDRFEEAYTGQEYSETESAEKKTESIKDITKDIVKELQEGRLRMASEYSEEHGVITVLKDARTIVAGKSDKIYINTNGNPGMATGGSGDVLTGIIAGLLGRGLSPENAAVAGVYIHGAAGDAAASKIGINSMIAGDILAGISEAYKCITE